MTEFRALLLALATCSLIIAGVVWAGPMVLTDNVTLTSVTPVAMGTDQGRMRLAFRVKTGQPDEGVIRGPMAVPDSKWPHILPGEEWAIGIDTSGGSTAQSMVKCALTSSTPVVVEMTEEGEMRGATTVTATATATAVDTATPVPPTATPSATPT